MGTPLYNTDIIPLTSRPTLTVMDDGDYFVILDTSTWEISKILRTDVQKALNISYDNATSGLAAENVQAVLDELVVNLGSSDSVISALAGRLDSTELTLARQGQDLASVKQTLQQGNGATLDFSGIGSVALDARATGRANPLVEGRTATNLVVNGDCAIDSNGDGLANNWWTNGADATSPYIESNAQYWNVVTQPSWASSVTVDIPKVPFKIGDVIALIYDNRAGGGAGSAIYLGTFADGTKILLGTRSSIANIHIKRVTMSDNDTVARLTFYSSLGLNGVGNVRLINLTQTFGAGNEPSASDCAKIFSNYFDGTKSIQLPARIVSKSEDESESSTLYIADNEEVRSFGATTDLVKVVNGEFVLEKNVNDDATAVISPPVTTKLLTSGIIQAKPNGTVYYEPYYESSHQTNASSQITLPYEGTIDKVTGYDENLETYEVPSTAYTLVGNTLTITGAVENEVFYVELSRSEPLAPELTINTLNNDQVTLDSADGKYYQIGFTTTNGVPTVTATEVL